MSSEEELSCITLIERIKKDHMAELDEQQELFMESQQTQTPFKEAADTIECHVNHLRRQYLRVITALELIQTEYTDHRREVNQSTGLHVNTLGGVPMSDADVARMENRLQAFKEHHHLFEIIDVQRGLMKHLRWHTKRRVLPARVSNHLAFEATHGLLGWSTSFSVEQGWMRLFLIEKLKKHVKMCGTLVDTLWDKELTLAIVHPSKRRRCE